MRPFFRSALIVLAYCACAFGLAQAGGCGTVKNALVTLAPHAARFGGCVIKCMSSTPLEEPAADAKKVSP